MPGESWHKDNLTIGHFNVRTVLSKDILMKWHFDARRILTLWRIEDRTFLRNVILMQGQFNIRTIWRTNILTVGQFGERRFECGDKTVCIILVFQQLQLYKVLTVSLLFNECFFIYIVLSNREQIMALSLSLNIWELKYVRKRKKNIYFKYSTYLPTYLSIHLSTHPHKIF